MNWYACELHCHTLHSDGQMSPETLMAEAERMELTAVALTDHNSCSAWPEVHPQTIKGIEWTAYHGHLCVLGPAAMEMDWRKLDDSLTIDEMLRQLRLKDSVCGVAHPFRMGDPVCTGCRFEYRVKDSHLLHYWEVWSQEDAPLMNSNKRSVREWEALLDRGCRLAPVYGRDWHRPGRGKRAACTFLGMEGDFSPDKAIIALRESHTLVSMGPRPQVTLAQAGRVYEPGDKVMQGQAQITAGLDLKSRLAIWRDYSLQVLTVALIQTGGKLLEEQAFQEEGNRFEAFLDRGWVRVEYRGLLGDEACVIALCAPFYIRPQTLITAHAGAEGTRDNSLESLKTLAALGADAVEMDIYPDEAGELRLSHDKPGASAPTLKEAFQILEGYPCLRINCDLKRTGLAAPVLSLARDFGLGSRLIFTGALDDDELSLIRQSEAEAWENWEKPSLDAIPDGLKVNVPFSRARAKTIAKLRQRGIGLSCWTVNSPFTLKRLMREGVTNITSRRPILALKIRESLLLRS